jgi:alpha-L-fucosidase
MLRTLRTGLVASSIPLILACRAPASGPEAPAPLAPLPSARQLAWADLEFCAFVHFNMDTFTGAEWGTGTEDPRLFAPTALDCRQWARVAKEAGMKGIVLTAKHHDGFCLWPSAYTEHDVASSPWKDGKGDVLRELSDACREQGLKFGVYLSPWDRNAPSYGDSPKYNDYYANQLREVLSNYGPIFEVWWDGACGEGPNGKRQVYDFERFTKLVRELQPDAVIFSDIGPDIRWVGNEAGFAGETCWSMISPAGFSRGEGGPPVGVLNGGLADGTDWIPAECDVSIRPGWYYHAEQDGQVKSLEALEDIWYASVGRNASLLLNLPVDRRGLVHEHDAARLGELRATLDATFATDLARGASASADRERPGFGASFVCDGDPATYWAAGAGQTGGRIELALGSERTVNRIVLREPVALGQRVAAFTVFAHDAKSGAWSELARGTTIGRKRILRVPTTRADRLAVEIQHARGEPLLSEVGAFAAPPKVEIVTDVRQFFLALDVVARCDDPSARLVYTLDGSTPTAASPELPRPLTLKDGGTLSVVALSENGASAPARAEFRELEAKDLLQGTHFVRTPDKGLRWSYFEGAWTNLDALVGAQPLATGTCELFDFDAIARTEHFALVWEGWIQAPDTGVFRFGVKSDDGSRLWIDDRLVVDHDGLHGMTEKHGTVGLFAGWHRFRLAVFNATGAYGVSLRWTPPKKSEVDIPSYVFGR